MLRSCRTFRFDYMSALRRWKLVPGLDVTEQSVEDFLRAVFKLPLFKTLELFGEARDRGGLQGHCTALPLGC